MTNKEIKLSKEDDVYFIIEEVVLALKTEKEPNVDWVIKQLEKAQKIVVDDKEE